MADKEIKEEAHIIDLEERIRKLEKQLKELLVAITNGKRY